MLAIKLNAQDLANPPIKTSSGWKVGDGVVEPYAHPALHAECVSSGRRTVFSVRERHNRDYKPHSGSAPLSERALDQYLSELRSWPLDFVCMVITREEGVAGIKIFCGRWGTAPLYLLVRDHTLNAHWNITALYDKLPGTTLAPVFAAQYLTLLDHPYSRRTIFPDICMLTERSTATWLPPFEHIAIKYPSDEANSQAQRLKRGADVTGMFCEILRTSMQSRILSEDQVVAIELSGGLDSTIVAAIASRLSANPARSYGMIMPGPDGEWQRRRRDDTVRRFGLLDRAFPAQDYPPFCASSSRINNSSVIPFGEFYDEAVGRLLDLAKEDGAKFIFTGMGGDELCTYQPGEEAGVEICDSDDGPEEDAEECPIFTQLTYEALRDGMERIDHAPNSLLHKSTLESAMAVSALYLSKGIWPISPLCTPDLVEFCRCLPFGWRKNRQIEREVLSSLGCPRLVSHPTNLETFLDVMHGALTLHSATTIGTLFKESRLAEQGLVNPDRLSLEYARYQMGDRRYEDQILAAATLELTLRSIESRVA